MGALSGLFDSEYFGQLFPVASNGLLIGFVLAFVPWLVGSFFRLLHKFMS